MDLRNYLSQINTKKTSFLKLQTIKDAGLINYPFIVTSLPEKIQPANLKNHLWQIGLSGHPSYTNLQLTDLQFIKFIQQINHMEIGDKLTFTEIFDETHNRSKGFKVAVDNQKPVYTIKEKEITNEDTTHSDDNRMPDASQANTKEQRENVGISQDSIQEGCNGDRQLHTEGEGVIGEIGQDNKGAGMSKALDTWDAIVRQYPNEKLSHHDSDKFIRNELYNHIDNQSMTLCFQDWKKLHKDLKQYCIPRVASAPVRKKFIDKLIEALEKKHPEILVKDETKVEAIDFTSLPEEEQQKQLEAIDWSDK